MRRRCGCARGAADESVGTKWFPLIILVLCVVVVSAASTAFLFLAGQRVTTANAQLDRAQCWLKIARSTRSATQALQLEVVNTWFESGYSLCAAAIAYPAATTFDLFGLTDASFGPNVYSAAQSVVSGCRAMGANATLDVDGRRAMFATTRAFAVNTIAPVTNAAVSSLEGVLTECSSAIEADSPEALLGVVKTGFRNYLTGMRGLVAVNGHINGHVANPMLMESSEVVVKLLSRVSSGWSTDALSLEKNLLQWVQMISNNRLLTTDALVLTLFPAGNVTWTNRGWECMCLPPYTAHMHSFALGLLAGVQRSAALSAMRAATILESGESGRPLASEASSMVNTIYDDTTYLIKMTPVATTQQMWYQAYWVQPALNFAPLKLLQQSTRQETTMSSLLEASGQDLIANTKDNRQQAIWLLLSAVLCVVVTIGAVSALVALVRKLESNRNTQKEAESRTRFLRTLMHEQRIPLNSMALAVGLLADSDAGALAAMKARAAECSSGEDVALCERLLPEAKRIGEERSAYLQAITAACDRLVHLSNDTLNLERMRAGKLSLRVEQVCFSAIVHQAVSLLRAQASHKGLTMVVTVKGSAELVALVARKARRHALHTAHNSNNNVLGSLTDKADQLVAMPAPTVARTSSNGSTVTASPALSSDNIVLSPSSSSSAGNLGSNTNAASEVNVLIDAALVSLDVSKFVSIVCNVVSNGIRFSPHGGKIQVKATVSPAPSSSAASSSSSSASAAPSSSASLPGKQQQGSGATKPGVKGFQQAVAGLFGPKPSSSKATASTDKKAAAATETGSAVVVVSNPALNYGPSKARRSSSASSSSSSSSSSAWEQTGDPAASSEPAMFTVPVVIRVEISDEGPGIAPEHKKQLFKPFFQVPTPTTTATTTTTAQSSASGAASSTPFEETASASSIAAAPSSPGPKAALGAPTSSSAGIMSASDTSGLGLALSREYARLHGGELSVESTVGKGCTFILAFPTEMQVPLSPPQPATTTAEADDDHTGVPSSPGHGAAAFSGAASPKHTPLPGLGLSSTATSVNSSAYNLNLTALSPSPASLLPGALAFAFPSPPSVDTTPRLTSPHQGGHIEMAGRNKSSDDGSSSGGDSGDATPTTANSTSTADSRRMLLSSSSEGGSGGRGAAQMRKSLRALYAEQPNDSRSNLSTRVEDSVDDVAAAEADDDDDDDEEEEEAFTVVRKGLGGASSSLSMGLGSVGSGSNGSSSNSLLHSAGSGSGTAAAQTAASSLGRKALASLPGPHRAAPSTPHHHLQLPATRNISATSHSSSSSSASTASGMSMTTVTASAATSRRVSDSTSIGAGTGMGMGMGIGGMSVNGTPGTTTRGQSVSPKSGRSSSRSGSGSGSVNGGSDCATGVDSEGDGSGRSSQTTTTSAGTPARQASPAPNASSSSSRQSSPAGIAGSAPANLASVPAPNHGSSTHLPPPPPASTAAEPSLATLLKGHRVLVTDDDGTNRMLLARLFSVLGAGEVDTASDGQEAVDKVKASLKGGGDNNRPYTILALDRHMPRKTGEAAARELRSASVGFKGLILAVSGDSLHTERQAFIAAGADLVLSKPLSKKAVADALWEKLTGNASSGAGRR